MRIAGVLKLNEPLASDLYLNVKNLKYELAKFFNPGGLDGLPGVWPSVSGRNVFSDGGVTCIYAGNIRCSYLGNHQSHEG
jgi:hypothetical protein